MFGKFNFNFFLILQSFLLRFFLHWVIRKKILKPLEKFLTGLKINYKVNFISSSSHARKNSSEFHLFNEMLSSHLKYKRKFILRNTNFNKSACRYLMQNAWVNFTKCPNLSFNIKFNSPKNVPSKNFPLFNISTASMAVWCVHTQKWMLLLLKNSWLPVAWNRKKEAK